MKTGIAKPGEGRSVWVVGDRYTIKVSGDDSAGAFAMIEAWIPPGSGPPPHIHHRDDEGFYLLEGSVEFHVDGQVLRPEPGAWITLEKGSLHWFRNVGESPARMLILATPAGIERFFLEVGRPATEADEPLPPTPEEIERLLAVSASYGLEIRPPAH